MRVTLDTNALVRIVVADDAAQTAAAQKIITDATLIVLTVPCLCELVWVLRRVYNFDREAIATALKTLANTGNIIIDRPTVEAGIQFLDLGGDFADGAIAFEGRALGGETFVSFDKRAVMLVEQQGGSARLLKTTRS
jgi:predicted nucleic-acid-binding protein